MKRILPLILLLLLLVACTPKKGDEQTTATEAATESEAVTLPKIEGIETDEDGGFILPTIPI